MRDLEHMARVRELGCYAPIFIERKCQALMEIEDPQERADLEMDFISLVAEHGQCGGMPEADHVGLDRGASIKASDTSCICLCSVHHRQRQTHSGLWDGYTKEEMRRANEEALAFTLNSLATRPKNLMGPDGESR